MSGPYSSAVRQSCRDRCPAPLISLCDDYSLPVDYVNKRRPASASGITSTSTVQWALPSPSVENVSKKNSQDQYTYITSINI
ncbi:hypothetical protein PV325_006542 [Microctonus aethiopoides]|nr:hypothetical protein PV325_006542 [Microctonus aethiopoides]